MKYKWVRHNGEKLYDVGIMPDGSLHNPRGYPEDLVRAAVLGADNRIHQRRSDAATRAAMTRNRRQERRTYEVAKRFSETGVFCGPRKNCFICGRGVSDAESIARGVGAECWQGVLTLIEEANAPQRPALRQGGGV